MHRLALRVGCIFGLQNEKSECWSGSIPPSPFPYPLPLRLLRKASGEPTCLGDKSLSHRRVQHLPPRPLPPALKARHTQVVKLPVRSVYTRLMSPTCCCGQPPPVPRQLPAPTCPSSTPRTTFRACLPSPAPTAHLHTSIPFSLSDWGLQPQVYSLRGWPQSVMVKGINFRVRLPGFKSWLSCLLAISMGYLIS